MMPNNVSITVGKKQHTLKNTVMSLPDKFIVFLGRTFSGHNHDYRMLKQELPPELDWFAEINVRVDLGYLGMQSDYRGDQIDIPTRKPHKSKKNPNPQFSDEQKAANTALSRVRCGRTSQCGEGWHSNEKTVRFWVPSPRVPKETDARCYAYTTPYTTMIPLCNVC